MGGINVNLSQLELLVILEALNRAQEYYEDDSELVATAAYTEIMDVINKLDKLT